MCSINHDLKAIYIHIPKCGGTFIQNILSHYYNFDNIDLPHENHINFCSIFDNNDKCIQSECDDVSNEDNFFNNCYNITEAGILRYNSSSKFFNYIMKMTEDKWRDYKKFTIIRNPYDKFVSAWKSVNINLQLTKKLNMLQVVNFEEYSRKSKSELYDYYKFAYSHSHITMYDHLIDVNNELHIDYIGSFENLNEDLCDILLKLGVDKIKHRKELEENIKYNVNERAAYIEYYDDSILEKVNELLQKDFDAFKQYKQVFSLQEMKEESAKYLVSEEEFEQKNVNLIKKLENKNLIENGNV